MKFVYISIILFTASKFYSSDNIFSLTIFVSVVSVRFIPLYGSLSSSIISMKTNYPSIHLIAKELEKRDKALNYLKLQKNKIIKDKNFLSIKNLEFSIVKNPIK